MSYAESCLCVLPSPSANNNYRGECVEWRLQFVPFFVGMRMYCRLVIVARRYTLHQQKTLPLRVRMSHMRVGVMGDVGMMGVAGVRRIGLGMGKWGALASGVRLLHQALVEPVVAGLRVT